MLNLLGSPEERYWRQRRRVNTFIVVFLLGGAFWLTSWRVETSNDDIHRGNEIKETGTNDKAAASETVHSVTWKTKADQVAKARSELARLCRAAGNASQSELAEPLMERLDLVAEFFQENEEVLSLEAEIGAPLAGEVDHLVAQVEQIPQLLRSSTSVSPTPNDSELLAEIDGIVLQEDARFQQQALHEAAVVFAPDRRKMEKEIAQLKYETRDLQEEAALVQMKNDVDLRKQKEELARAERKRLLERDLLEVRRLLSPFISPGHEQPKTSAWDRICTVEAGPVSLKQLEKIGALKQTMEGLKSLAVFGGMNAPGFGGERPLGDFPEYTASTLANPRDLETIRRAQDLLRLHGKAMVDAKMLAP
jgi:hypothetical protein